MSKKYSVLVLIAVTLSFFGCGKKVQEIPQYGLFEVSFESNNASPFQFPEVSFLLPDGDIVEVDGFYDGGKMYRARAYCKKPGLWKWEVNKAPGFVKMVGKFKVVDSTLKRKLKKHPDDQYQFAYDNNDWFLHIGDTGYRYLTESKKNGKNILTRQ